MMNLLEVTKSLANETRLNILYWLKEPYSHFPEEELGTDTFELGICVSDIAKKAEMSVPTVSDYLKTLSDTGLLVSKRKGQWTYYKRNENAIQELADLIKNKL